MMLDCAFSSVCCLLSLSFEYLEDYSPFNSKSSDRQSGYVDAQILYEHHQDTTDAP